jgi:hypothetical protein
MHGSKDMLANTAGKRTIADHAHIWRHYFRSLEHILVVKNEFQKILRSLSRFCMPREWGFVFETLNLSAESLRWHDEIENFSA